MARLLSLIDPESDYIEKSDLKSLQNKTKCKKLLRAGIKS